MNPRLTDFEKRLCNLLQNRIPVTQKPFEKIADKLLTSENQILQKIKKLKKQGIIRRLGPVLNYRALGRKSTLVTAHLGKEKLPEVVKAVNGLPCVSHNYLRDHYYNLWFTVQGKSEKEIKQSLANFSRRFNIQFHSVPAAQTFKLDVRFDAESGGTKLLKSKQPAPIEKKVRLNLIEKQVVSKLHTDLQIKQQPFDFLCTDKLSIQKVIQTLQRLIKKGVIRRVAAAVDYRKLGFRANVLFACKVQRTKIGQAGNNLAKLPIVSHCYERKGFKGFDYNLFAMLHAESKEEINRIVNDFTGKEKIKDYVLLATVRELRKNSSGIF